MGSGPFRGNNFGVPNSWNTMHKCSFGMKLAKYLIIWNIDIQETSHNYSKEFNT
jgi:hypothetical protein